MTSALTPPGKTVQGQTSGTACTCTSSHSSLAFCVMGFLPSAGIVLLPNGGGKKVTNFFIFRSGKAALDLFLHMLINGHFWYH